MAAEAALDGLYVLRTSVPARPSITNADEGWIAHQASASRTDQFVASDDIPTVRALSLAEECTADEGLLILISNITQLELATSLKEPPQREKEHSFTFQESVLFEMPV
jgi:hypothetical protein